MVRLIVLADILDAGVSRGLLEELHGALFAQRVHV